MHFICLIFPGMTGKIEDFPPMNRTACYYDEGEFLGGKSSFSPAIPGKIKQNT